MGDVFQYYDTYDGELKTAIKGVIFGMTRLLEGDHLSEAFKALIILIRKGLYQEKSLSHYYASELDRMLNLVEFTSLTGIVSTCLTLTQEVPSDDKVLQDQPYFVLMNHALEAISILNVDIGTEMDEIFEFLTGFLKAQFEIYEYSLRFRYHGFVTIYLYLLDELDIALSGCFDRNGQVKRFGYQLQRPVGIFRGHFLT